MPLASEANQQIDISCEQDIFEREIILDDLKRTLQFATTDEQKFRSRTKELTTQQRKFSKLQTKIEKSLIKSKLFNKEEQIKIRNDFDDSYYAILTHLSKLKLDDEHCRRMSRSIGLSDSFHGNSSSPKLPKLPLPSFSGNSTDWNSFYDLYLSLIHNNNAYTDAEKFRYLLLTLKNEPYDLIKAIPITDANYNIALHILVSRYENKRVIATTHLHKILDIEPCSDKSTISLRNLLNTYHENIRPLQVMRFPTNEWSFILLTILLRKIPLSIRKRYELSLQSPSDIPDIDTLINFLERELSANEISSSNCNISHRFFSKEGSNTKNVSLQRGPLPLGDRSHTFATNIGPTAKSTHNFEPKSQRVKSYNCLYCGALHTLTKCLMFLNLSPQERYSFVSGKNICLNCLHVGHELSNCNSTFTCRSCNKRHHTLIHFENNSCLGVSESQVYNSDAPCQLTSDESTTSINPQLVMTSVNSVPRDCSVRSNAPPVCATTVLLSTALVDVIVDCERRASVRCLIDTGSQASFISEACAERLRLARKYINMPPVYGISGNKPVHPKGLVSCFITSTNKNKSLIQIDALILPKLITSQMPSCQLPYTGWAHIKNLTLADPDFYTPQPVEMLLGADVLPQILLNNTITGLPGTPIAINSIFGYLLLGKINLNSSSNISAPVQVCHSSVNDDFDLQRFWELESISEQRSLTSEELLCENIFVNTHTRTETGQYVVALPFKPNASPLGESRDIALARFRKLENKLERDSKLKQDYHACLQEYLDLGHMEPVIDFPSASSSYYIPHHCVVKESSKTTKTRVVFDAGCKTTNQNSLNDVLLIGQKLHLDIVDVLLKFRIHSIAFTADIKQMYRNIKVRESDMDFQRIVWRTSPDEPVRDYRLRTVTFGVSSSPYLALRTIQQLAIDEAVHFPRAAHVLKNDVFVDDIISGDKTVDSALFLQQELIAICQAAGFVLHKWHSNSSAILAAVQPTHSHGERHSNVPFAEFENDMNIKVLGLQWNPQADSFSFSVKISSVHCTKRSILSQIARIYDPLGLLSPVTLFAKHLIQLLWIASVDWDDEPPQDIVNAWFSFVHELPLLSSVTFPRHVFPLNCVVQLHGFSDASEKAYAACVYLRLQGIDKSVTTSLLLAKTRVAPTKRVSIPRLELMAAVLLSKLIRTILNNYNKFIKSDQIYAWSDSSVVLAWLRASPHEWKTFVSNRITEIVNNVPSCRWRHVPSGSNPADPASRGMLPAVFLQNDMWFNGPEFLKREETSWPSLSDMFYTEEEKRCPAICANPTTSVQGAFNNVEVISYFSSLGKLVRVTALIFRFYKKCKKIQCSFPPNITVPEFNCILKQLIKLVQHSVFEEDIVSISKQKQPSNQLRRLNPFLDADNILRVGGRIHKSLLSYDAKHQMILPKKHPLTLLIIDDAHISQLHSGAQSTQYMLLQKYWILSARDVIRQRIYRCIRCFRTRPVRPQPSMAPLPAARLRPERPFLKTSVDFGGPFYVRANKVRNAKIVKCYVSVFVCMCTKAIHLEIVSELSTEGFLAALRRFTSRRGLCTDIYSDCGKNFIGCDRYLRELFLFLKNDSVQNTLHKRTLQQGITWHFQPPYASHFGGLFEAGVKSFKHHLQRVIGTRTLTYDEMHTLLCQIEAVLNSRPLCVLSSDAKDPLPLTPSHFLIGEPLTAIPDVSLIGENTSRLVRWRLIQQSLQHFWHKWSREYLHEIQQRGKWFSDRGPPVREGMIVVMCDDNLPPLHWRLARIHALHPGTDGIIRVVTLQSGNAFFKRPVIKICPLPVE